MSFFDSNAELKRKDKFWIILICMLIGVFSNVLLFPLLDIQGNSIITKISMMLSTILTFALPAILAGIVLSRQESTTSYLGLSKAETNLSKVVLYVLVVVFMLSLLPFNNLIGTFNANYSFPDFLKPLEDFFREQDKASLEQTSKILLAENFGEFLLNLLVIAITPAVCEELFFRGLLQNRFISLCKSPVFGIIVTSFVFSVVHFQFSGLIPRFLLALVLGFLYHKTKSIFPSILAHFANNGLVVVVVYFFNINTEGATEMVEYANWGWIVAITGGLIVAGIAGYFLFLFNKRKVEDEI